MTDFEALVLSKVTAVRGKNGAKIATQLGFESYQAVSRALGRLERTGRIVKTDSGYILA